MNKFWRVAWYEYSRHVFRRRFIFALLGLPLTIAFFIGLGVVLGSALERSEPIGYVDASGVVTGEVDATLDEDAEVSILRFETVDAARAALDAGQIQGYFVLPADYPQTRDVELYYLKQPGESIQRQFIDFVRGNLVKQFSRERAQIVLDGLDWTIRSPDGSRQFSGPPGVINLLTPLLAGVAFMIALLAG
ncbi:MAG: ABC transporter permease, partial [Longimicrobiales bacterium]